jgi:hypothetical protein
MPDLSISNPMVRKAVYAAFGGKCFYTGQPLPQDGFQIDHVIPQMKGGADSFDNYVLSTPRINMRKGATPIGPGASHLVKAVYAPIAEAEFRRLVRENNAAKPPRPHPLLNLGTARTCERILPPGERLEEWIRAWEQYNLNSRRGEYEVKTFRSALQNEKSKLWWQTDFIKYCERRKAVTSNPGQSY